MFRLTTEIISAYDRILFDITSYEKYMNSVENVLDTCKKFLVSELPDMISHTCSGIDIKTCNPNEPLFYIN